jgi:hypothetical protein
MMDHDRCPDCRSFDTDREEVNWLATEVEEMRTCGNCSMTFANKFDMVEREEDALL